jgi:hypothetical protein
VDQSSKPKVKLQQVTQTEVKQKTNRKQRSFSHDTGHDNARESKASVVKQTSKPKQTEQWSGWCRPKSGQRKDPRQREKEKTSDEKANEGYRVGWDGPNTKPVI